MSIRLGEFEVLEPLARGGMGQVWRARHPGQDLPVAIKVMAEDIAEIPTWRERFRTEVRSMAALEHPGVVWVFDYGEVTPEAFEASEGRLPLRAPWVAMEFASSGTLDQRVGSLRWSGIRGLLLWVLDTLAHAHARRVIHRDLKPANVLLGGAGDLRPGPKLADFGIAASLEDDQTLGERMLGTPAYMAPEQILSLRSDLGPWTDLYALGCLTWELVCGVPPFDNADRGQILFAHLSSPLPQFQPRIAVPAELLSWLQVLLAKAPDRRFASAPEAALALRGLTEIPDEEPQDPELRTLLRSTAHSTLPLTRTSGERSPRALRATWFEDATLTEASVALDADTTGTHSWPVPGCPLDWRRPVPVRRSRQLQGAGLALVGLRAVPLAGRMAERDALWQTLVAVDTEERARAVVLRGPAGTGKSRLARWLGERAVEVGAARYLVARHGPDDAPGDGIAAAFRSELRSWDRPAGQRKARLVELLGESLGDAVGGWLHPEDEPDRTMAGASERYALIGAVLERMAERRPVILHLDDVHASGDAMLLIDYLIKRQRVSPCALMILATVQEEALAETPRYRQRLEELCTLDDVATLRLAPLGLPQRVALLDGLLGLDGETAAQVLDRTGGNPLFAVQLVGEWAAQGLLVAGRRGFRLADPAAADEAVSLDSLWGPRIERALEGLLPGAGMWLERVALAGEMVESRELVWLAEGLDLGIDREGMQQTVLDRLCDARLGVRADGRFAFVHGLVRDALRARATRAGRLVDHHSALAQRMLLQTAPDSIAVGRHLLLADQPVAAARLLVDGLADHRYRFGERAGLMACELAERALKARGAPASDPDWGRVALERILALSGVGDGQAARAAVDQLLIDAVAHGWPPEIRLAAAAEQAHFAVFSGEYERAYALLDAIEADPEVAERYQVRVHYLRYCLGEFTNRLDRCRSNGELAADGYERLGDPRSRYMAAQIRGVLGFMFGDVEEAEPWVREAVVRSEATGAVQSRARALHNLGKVHWYRKRWAEAERALEQSEELYLQAGSVSLGGTRLVRIQVRLVQRQFADALALCNDLVDKIDGQSTSLKLLELVATAGMKQWDNFDARFEEIQGELRARGWANGEDATALEQLGALALEQGMPERTRRIWEEALDHWSRHDFREHEEAKLTEWLAKLG